MRVISGSARGRKLESLNGDDTRPTLDRVKEALFGRVQFDCIDAIGLDLFAGSGALGIEALSRGAKKMYFNEQNHAAGEIVRKNIKALGMEQESVLMCLPFEQALEKLASQKIVFDIIFLDPPYNLGLEQTAVDMILEKQLLSKNGCICIEQEWNTPIVFAQNMSVDTRKYGQVAMSIYRK